MLKFQQLTSTFTISIITLCFTVKATIFDEYAGGTHETYVLVNCSFSFLTLLLSFLDRVYISGRPRINFQ